ncbi:poly(3-hydroxybutyrate) depolymerase PhaZ [Duganella sp. Leaf126]|uniref:extracellular catalytic domain type 1 short-chain-length polyhydroxyalkanoate depolymerase n=1 Tax=Duganella sp. Leaf126 TaxID=1736266 RepID=UPI0007014967|nr:PHB depolymerase family esterase [Duganella sp. Leaf126]KQQ40000.1 poly(3-hydroxybutyrate) depolymerase PhaZ [Duganella sp. Leaf126]
MTHHLQRTLWHALVCILLCWAWPAWSATPGPGKWSAQQSWAADSVNGGNLTGFFYWPASEPTIGGKRALVLVLHGCKQTAASDVIDANDGGYNWAAMGDKYGAVILAPNAPGNVYYNHCWDYANTSHTRSGGGHDKVLLDLVDRFVKNPQYQIDPNQVYVTGLSSGGGETMVMGCLAPDVFAGVGINAGPTPGTTTIQIGGVPTGYTAATAASRCKAMAGSAADKFSTQIAGAVWGTFDYTVDQKYGPLATEAMRIIYGGTFTRGAAENIPGGGVNIPYLDSNRKVRTHEITVTGLGHAWPAGPGGQNTNFVDNTKINYPAFVMDFWYKNNLRIGTSTGPEMTSCSAAGISTTSATVSGAATGEVKNYTVVLNGPTAVNDSAAGSGSNFSRTYNLAAGNYSGTVTATDSANRNSAACSIAPFSVGTAPALTPPTNVAAGAVTDSSVPLTWNAAGAATGYNVYVNGARVTSTPVTATSYTVTGLTANTAYTITVSSVGNGGESAQSSPLSVTTSAGNGGWTCTTVTATNYAHVQAGRATVKFGLAYANGSNDLMGLSTVFFRTTLAQTAQDFYKVGNCP